ncbi:hypothetical protein IWW34DRAFT_801717 [Fusarium oxysporum f. sp. albedinis]|nr:hypothetical protein IWW34DRAFT_801717 [Fusarium oxysporum f. sp. albedinis]
MLFRFYSPTRNIRGVAVVANGIWKHRIHAKEASYHVPDFGRGIKEVVAQFTFIDQKLKPAHLHSVTSDESTHLDHQITASSLLKHFFAVSPRAYELTIRVIGASVTIDPPGKHLKLARNQYQHSPPRQHHLRFVQVYNIPPIRRSAPRPRTYNTK